jgi:hypothetical protein
MKKILFSILLICTPLVYAMEEPLSLSEIIRTCPNQIIYHLDGKTFISLMKVAHLFQEICSSIPIKYLNMLFSDAVKQKNTALIDRFIAQPDSWMFRTEMNSRSICIEEDNDNTITMFARSFGKGLDKFFGIQPFLCISQNGKIVRYLLSQSSFCDCNAHSIYLNVDECNETINKSITKILSNYSKEVATQTNFFNFVNKPAHGEYFGTNSKGQSARRCFSISGLSHSTESILKQFGMITLFLIAARRNNTNVTYAILNNAEIIDSWSLDLLEIALNDLNNGNQIKDVVAAKIFERKTKALSTIQ